MPTAAPVLDRLRRAVARARQDPRLAELDVLLVERIVELAAVQPVPLQLTPALAAEMIGTSERGAARILGRLVRLRYIPAADPPG